MVTIHKLSLLGPEIDHAMLHFVEEQYRPTDRSIPSHPIPPSHLFAFVTVLVLGVFLGSALALGSPPAPTPPLHSSAERRRELHPRALPLARDQSCNCFCSPVHLGGGDEMQSKSITVHPSTVPTPTPTPIHTHTHFKQPPPTLLRD